jgi:putative ABC transport system permease protein
MIGLTLKSFRFRKFTIGLCLLSIALSVGLLLFVERLRNAARESFNGTISKTDLIVGARGGGINLLLYSVFRMGNATNNISIETANWVKNHPAVAWTIPISLGDSYRGFRVVATDQSFFEHYKYRNGTSVVFSEGSWSAGVLTASVGSKVAKELNLKIGDSISLAHGISSGPAILEHSDKPFRVTGILSPTQTPLDKSVYINLSGMEAIHLDWENGLPPILGEEVNINSISSQKLEPKTITSLLVGTKNKIDSLRLQREINEYSNEPIMAIIPGVTLSELWGTVEYAETALQLISYAVGLVGVVSILISVQSTLNSRRREIAIFRALGASAKKVFLLFLTESFLLSFIGVCISLVLTLFLSVSMKSILESTFGIALPYFAISGTEFFFAGCAILFSTLSGLIPSFMAYKYTLSDALSPKL